MSEQFHVFEHYAPWIQDYIYEHGWRTLRQVQDATGRAIFTTDNHVLVCASTASGKTEAAFFPILSLLDRHPSSTVGVLYIAPLKALINDQFERLDELCEDADIRVTKWHGDASRSAKDKLIRKPEGIVQITPESLESLLINKSMIIPALFGDLRFIIIDEIHALLRSDRGLQTFACIERLCRLAGCNPRRVGLSATIGNPHSAAQFLAAGSNRSTCIPDCGETHDIWRINMEHFYSTDPQADDAQTDIGLTAINSPHRVNAQSNNLVSSDAHVGVDVPVPHMNMPTAHMNVSAQSSAEASPDTATYSLSHISEQSAFLQQQEPARMAPQEPVTDYAPRNNNPSIAYIFEHTLGKKCLIFTNSREECEIVCQQLRQLCMRKGEVDRFLIHHGNLSTAVREIAEEEMKDEHSLISICATATLELGIDIGKLERAFHIDAPFTVSGFLQRLGRTGRRGSPSEMWFVMREQHPESRAMFTELIPWSLLQGIAIIQLYAEERFVEPARLTRIPYSLLYHQTMSTLKSLGELTAAQLAHRVLTLSCFKSVSTDDYRMLLLHLLDMQHIERTETGGLIIGVAGERVVNSYNFYAVFQDNIEFSVRDGSTELGTIVGPPPAGDTIAIAGRVWVVDEIDYKRRIVFCSVVEGIKEAYFGDVPGDIHTRILERMRQVVAEPTQYPYLLPHAAARLQQTRELAAHVGFAQSPLNYISMKRYIPGAGYTETSSRYVLMPWLGTYAFLALERFLRIRCKTRLGLSGFQSVRPYYMQFSMKASAQEFFTILQEELDKDWSPMDLLYAKEVPRFDKYDEFLPDFLVRKGFAYGVLDIDGMKERIHEWAQRQPTVGTYSSIEQNDT